MDRGAWQATVHGVAKSQTPLSDFQVTSDLWRWYIGKESACQMQETPEMRVRCFQDPLEQGTATHPLPYSCLENSTDRGGWRATVLRVAKSRTQLSITIKKEKTQQNLGKDSQLPLVSQVGKEGHQWASLHVLRTKGRPGTLIGAWAVDRQEGQGCLRTHANSSITNNWESESWASFSLGRRGHAELSPSSLVASPSYGQKQNLCGKK